MICLRFCGFSVVLDDDDYDEDVDDNNDDDGNDDDDWGGLILILNRAVDRVLSRSPPQNMYLVKTSG